MKPGDRATLFLSPMDRHPVRIERLVDDTKAEVRFSNGATLVCPVSMLRARPGVG